MTINPFSMLMKKEVITSTEFRMKMVSNQPEEAEDVEFAVGEAEASVEAVAEAA
jgi:hypothetical protein